MKYHFDEASGYWRWCRDSKKINGCPHALAHKTLADIAILGGGTILTNTAAADGNGRVMRTVSKVSKSHFTVTSTGPYGNIYVYKRSGELVSRSTTKSRLDAVKRLAELEK